MSARYSTPLWAGWAGLRASRPGLAKDAPHAGAHQHQQRGPAEEGDDDALGDGVGDCERGQRRALHCFKQLGL